MEKDQKEITAADPQDGEAKRDGYGYLMASYFLIGQMAGAGFLSLPHAMADTGWIGLAMMPLFAVSIGYAGEKLGRSWLVMEERWEEYRGSCRQPYMEIGHRTFGKVGRILTLVCTLGALGGGNIVYLILMSQMLSSLLPGLSLCSWVLVMAAVLTPATWLGTPKDFWQASILAVVSTLLAVVVIDVTIIVDTVQDPPPFPPSYPNPTVASFSLGFGAILFSFGGANVFPTIQNDMKDKTLFWKSVVVAFAGLFAMYFPVAAIGYVAYGEAVESNILMSVDSGVAVTIAIVGELLNLLGTFVIVFNPVAQAFEDMLHVPSKFCVQRVVFRTCLLWCEALIALAVPDFGLILNLIGGSATTISCFILPPLMYMKLADDTSDPSWIRREIPLWERIFSWEIVIVGVVGGITSTISALYALLSPDSLGSSCFVDFHQ